MMKSKAIAILSAGIITVGAIGGVAFASTIDNSSKDNIKNLMEDNLEAKVITSKTDTIPLEEVEAFDDLVHPETTVWFGDKVLIEDNMSKEIFEIQIEANSYNKALMNDFSKDLLNRRIDEKFVFNEFEYRIVGIEKK